MKFIHQGPVADPRSTVNATHWYTGGIVSEVSCDCHRFFNSASVSNCCSIQRMLEAKSFLRVGGTLGERTSHAHSLIIADMALH